MVATVKIVSTLQGDVYVEAFEQANNPMHWKPFQCVTVPGGTSKTISAKLSLFGMKVRFVLGQEHFVFSLPGTSEILLNESGPQATASGSRIEPELRVWKKNVRLNSNFQFHCTKDLCVDFEEKGVDQQIKEFFQSPKSATPTVAAMGTGSVVGAAALGVAAPTAAVAGVQAIGFTSTGIAAGSTAAAMMSASAPVASGSLVAIGQSIGAVGALGAGASAGVGIVGALLGAVFVGAVVYGGFKLDEALKYKDEEVPCWDRCHHCHIHETKTK